jgi:hypothetical protein
MRLWRLNYFDRSFCEWIRYRIVKPFLVLYEGKREILAHTAAFWKITEFNLHYTTQTHRIHNITNHSSVFGHRGGASRHTAVGLFPFGNQHVCVYLVGGIPTAGAVSRLLYQLPWLTKHCNGFCF